MIHDQVTKDFDITTQAMTILIIEDNPHDIERLQDILVKEKNFSFHLESVSTLKEALEYLKTKSPDIILADLFLPDSHGTDTVEKIHQQMPRIPLVVLTSFHEELGIESLRRGAQDYLLKEEINARLLSRVIRYAIERNKIRETFRENEASFRLMLEQIPAVVWTTDKNLKITLSMGAGLKGLGLKPNQLIGSNLRQYLGAEDPEFLPLAAHLRALEGEASTYEMIWQERIFQTHIEPLLDKTGRVVGTVGVALDISENKKVEREQSTAMKASMDGMAILNSKEEYVYLNEAHVQIYGYDDPQELIGKTWQVLYESNELKRFKESIFPILWQKGKWRGEAIGKKRDGSLFPQEISLTAIKGGGLVCVVRDTTERKIAEENLRKSENLLRTVFDAMPHWVFVKDKESRVLLVNQKMASDYGISQEEFKNLPTEKTTLGKDEEKAFFIGVDQQVIATGESVNIPEEKITMPNGEVHYLHTIKVALKDSKGKVVGLVGVAEDITSRKKVEAELDTYRKHLEELVGERTKELQHSERLAATGRLAASIAHEINNPLQGITTHLEIMRDNLPKNFGKIKNYEFVKNNIEKIRGIVAKLLDTYRGADESKTEVDINDVLEKVVLLVEHQLTLKKIRLNLNFARNIPKIEGWRQQLYQVFLNLILNAQDSIRSKGDITITTSFDKNTVFIEVADTGEGINEEDMDHLFEPFFTTKSESGTGLGLFVSHGIIKEHNGSIKVKSEKGKGSIFTVSLPILKS